MATQDEVVGASIAAQALAAAAIKMLTRLGHSDMIEEIKSEALDTLTRSMDQASPGLGLDIEKAKETGRLSIMALTEAAKLTASPRTGSHQ